MGNYQNPADALAALANILTPAAPSASLLVGMSGVGFGRECSCDCGTLRIEMQGGMRPKDPNGLPLGDCGHLVMSVAVMWEQCVPVITSSGAAPEALAATNASLAALRNGWSLLRVLFASDEARWWRMVTMSPHGTGSCKGVRIELETDVRVCPDSTLKICN